jgi:hypothetical protein
MGCLLHLRIVIPVCHVELDRLCLLKVRCVMPFKFVLLFAALYRRGYRSGSAVHKAALNEAAAAGLLLLAGWQERSQHDGKGSCHIVVLLHP